MKIEKRSSNLYRVRKTVNGKTYTLNFDHKPTEREVITGINDMLESVDTVKDSFRNCAESYMNSKGNILSPTTIKGYYSILKALPESFKSERIGNLTQIDIQLVVNEYALNHSAKTTRNVHGFISAVFAMFRPNMVINTTLPQKRKYEPYIPSKEDISRILDASRGTMYHIPFQLGCLGMRRSEICALTLDDIQDGILTIDKTKVQNKNNEWIIKPLTKTEEGQRQIYIPTSLEDEIRANKVIVDCVPNQLLKSLQSYQSKLGIPKFRFHDLRHFYASYAHENGMSDADIMASGGWKSDYTMKSVYRHAMQKDKEEAQKKIANMII